MAERGIIFSAPMVRALLDGRKRQTRRLLSLDRYSAHLAGYSCTGLVKAYYGDHRLGVEFVDDARGLWHETRNPAGLSAWYVPLDYSVGDRLWVRESYYQCGDWIEDPTQLTRGGQSKWCFRPLDDEIQFEKPQEYRSGFRRSDPDALTMYKRLGRFMPRRYSRLTLIVEDVRVQRVQEISEADAVAEGLITAPMANDTRWKAFEDGEWMYDCPRKAFAALWDTLHDKPGERWDDNPWAVALTFRLELGNIDQRAAVTG